MPIPDQTNNVTTWDDNQHVSVGDTFDSWRKKTNGLKSSIDLKAPIASPTFTGTVSGITKAMVGLGSVNDTTDANKPVSTPQQTALNFKANIASPLFTGNVGIGNASTNTSAKLVIHEAIGTEASGTAGTLVLTHGNAGGASSIVFPSNRNFGAVGGDHGYIQYQDDLTIPGTGEKSRLIIGIQNDATASVDGDFIILKTATGGRVGINTMEPLATLHVEGNIRTSTPTDILHAATKGYVDTLVSTATTAQQTALNLKANIASPTFTGTVVLPTGTADAAPLKFVTGTNLSALAAGAVEFNGTNLFLTNNSGTSGALIRKTIAFTTDIPSFSLSGDVTGTQSATSITTSISDTTVTGKVLTGYNSTLSGLISATDTILTAIGKLNGNIASGAGLSGHLTSTSAHKAGSITTAAIGTIAASDVQSVLVSLVTDKLASSHKGENDAHAANKISIDSFTFTNAAAVSNTISAIEGTTTAGGLKKSIENLYKYAGNIVTDQIAKDAVTNDKIVNGTITDAKLATITAEGKVANSATSAASGSGTNTIVKRDDNGNFTANEIRATRLLVASGTPAAGLIPATRSIVFEGDQGTPPDTAFNHSTDGEIEVVCNGVLTVKFAAVADGRNALTANGSTVVNGNLTLNPSNATDGHLFIRNIKPTVFLRATDHTSAILYADTGKVYITGAKDKASDSDAIGTTRPFVVNLDNSRIGINTEVPDEALHVVGNIKASSGIISDTITTGNISSTGRLLINNTAPTIHLQDDTRSAAIQVNENKLYVLKDNGNNSFNYTGDRPFVVDLTNLRVGINVNTPTVALDVYGGTLGTTAGNELGLSNFRFNSDNDSRLAISAVRNASGSAWQTSSIILGMNVDTSVRPSSGTKGPAFMSLSGNGGVGIGAQDPLGKLHIHETTGTKADAISGTLVLTHGNAGGASSIVFPSKGNFGLPGGDYGYIQYQDDVATNGTGEKSRLIIGVENDYLPGYAGLEDFIILKTPVGGRVGINTMEPTATLDVNGTITAVGNIKTSGRLNVISGSATAPAIYPDTDTDTGIFFPSDNIIGLSSGGVERVRLNAGGSVTAKGDISGYYLFAPALNTDAFSHASRLEIRKDPTNPIFRINTFSEGTGIVNNLFVGTDRESYAFFDTNGKVGIGTTAPTAKLDVNGNIIATGTSSSISTSGASSSISSAGTISAVGNIYSADSISTGGNIGSGSNITSAGNISASGTSSSISTSGANSIISSAGTISAVGNITTAGTISAVGNISVSGTSSSISTTGGSSSISSAGTITAMGNITGGTITATGNITSSTGGFTGKSFNSTSSIKYKENVKPLTNALNLIEKLQGVTFDWKETGKSDIGLIAEQVNEVVPEFVLKDEEGLPKAIDYGKLTSILIEAVKELSALIKSQKS